MEIPPLPHQSAAESSTLETNSDSCAEAAAVDSTNYYSNRTLGAHFPDTTSMQKKKQKAAANSSVRQQSSYSSSTSLRVLNKRRSPTIFIGSVRRAHGEVDAIALPLGMSIAAVMSQVLEKKAEVGEAISVDHLSTLCTVAIRESLADAFGNKFDSFVRNFENSFKSTLRTLTQINETSISKRKGCLRNLSDESSTLGVNPPNTLLDSSNCGIESCHSVESESGRLEEVQENGELCAQNRELSLQFDGERNQQLACITTTNCRLGPANPSMLTTFERSVEEQARANDLKSFEISLQLQSLRLKETKLALNSDSNLLDRLKLSMGISKASFKAEKFKNQVEDTRHAELLKKCIDCLVAGLIIMSISLGYGAYVHSYKRIVEATASCAPTKGSKSWWVPNPMASFNSGLQTLGCQVQVLSRMLFGVLMILVIAYSLLQRSATSRVGMPITFILLILGVACGFAGKICVDTLGGNGYHWVLYWEGLCCLHFFSNVCTSLLFIILYGPVTAKKKSVFPFWCRRILFYAVMLLILPMFCGLMPFATHNEWKDHFSAVITNYRR